MPVRVINKHTATPQERARAVYIGRPSVLGNPFRVDPNVPAAQRTAISEHAWYLGRQLMTPGNPQLPVLLDLAKRSLAGEEVLLMCFCHPRPCHGDTLKAVIDGMAATLQEERA